MAGTATASTVDEKKRQATREKLVTELLDLRRKYEPFEPRDSEICELLKQDADADESFKIAIDKAGKVSVSASQEARCTGTMPELVIEAFLDLPDKEQARLLEKSVVKVTRQWKKEYSGQVRVTLFPGKKAA